MFLCVCVFFPYFTFFIFIYIFWKQLLFRLLNVLHVFGHVTVDGLICCNEQVGGTVVEETDNQTLLPSKKQLNVSKGHAHMSVNFPFLEGHPFTATLWVGPEGFHMTVNGRHETSFAYRKVRNDFNHDRLGLNLARTKT